MFINNNTIAILGVDGSGKSTAVENLMRIYGKKCSITYMGYTRFEDPQIEQLEGKLYALPLMEFRIYICFWKRYLKGCKTGEIAIFDRYVHEIFINASSNKVQKIRAFLYKHFFPMPSKMVYLYCPVEESLRRKSDIVNPKEFFLMKKRFDDFFLGRKDTLCLNSGVLSTTEITDQICKFIGNAGSK